MAGQYTDSGRPFVPPIVLACRQTPMTSSKSEQGARIAFVCHNRWVVIRQEAARLLRGSGLKPLESAAALVAEAEFRDLIPADDEFPFHVWAKLRQAGSSLGWMPPRRLKVELGLPVRDVGGLEAPQNQKPKQKLITDRSPVELVVVADEAPYALAAFEALDGSSEAWRGISLEPVVPNRGVMQEIVAKFGPLKSSRASPSPFAVQLDYQDAVQRVLHAGISESCYGDGGGAAHGRWGAWQTIAFLVAADPLAEFTEVSSRAERSAWIEFSVDTPWFDGGFWTGCIGCIDPSRTIVSVVAWSDS